MSRPTVQRTLTLTEELERLEQQITLTLQEIDSNFSKAHRIVTSSILPVVEDYAKHSNDVWESSKYWKQFFEAAANVSLSGYEEAALEDDLLGTSEHTATDLTTPEQQAAEFGQHDSDEESTVDSPTQISGMQSTPKLRTSGSRKQTSQASRVSPSPRRYTGKNPLAQTDEPSTPTAGHSLFSSPFQQESAFKPAEQGGKTHADPVLHRSVLDKNYRVQSTPFKTHQPNQQATETSSKTAAATVQRALWEDSPESSPELAPPQLRDDFFSPPKHSIPRQGPRTPGVSVQKMSKTKDTTMRSTDRALFSNDGRAGGRAAQTHSAYNFVDDDNDDEDADDSLGMSPPKTLQFHIPQSRLMQTPAREASKKIVDDLLATAGMADSLDDMGEEDLDSPSVIRASHGEDSTF